LLTTCRHPCSPLIPYTTLFRSQPVPDRGRALEPRGFPLCVTLSHPNFRRIKKRPGHTARAFSSKRYRELPLGVLRRLARLAQTDLLALHFTGGASHDAGLAERH